MPDCVPQACEQGATAATVSALSQRPESPLAAQARANFCRTLAWPAFSRLRTLVKLIVKRAKARAFSPVVHHQPTLCAPEYKKPTETAAKLLEDTLLHGTLIGTSLRCPKILVLLVHVSFTAKCGLALSVNF